VVPVGRGGRQVAAMVIDQSLAAIPESGTTVSLLLPAAFSAIARR
jgi:hypothetical protein